MLKQLRKRTEGFTIIEVMIVLAIAGLIMLIVFLAVPALQRNSRNTQRKSDIGRIGAAAQEVLNNNGGDTSKLTTATLRAAVTSGANPLSYYTAAGAITVAGGPPPAGANGTNGTNLNNVTVYIGGVCATVAAATGGQGATSTGAPTRGIAIIYHVETAAPAGIPACSAE